LVGLDEEPSELERLCLTARAQVEALYAAEDDVEDTLSDSNTEEWEADAEEPEEQEVDSTAMTALAAGARVLKLSAEPMELASSSCRSSGTLFLASGSYELSFDGSGPLNSTIESASCEDLGGSRSGEDLLFDLEEERAHGPGSRQGALDPCTPRTVARLPMALKPCAMLSPGGCSSMGEAASLSFSPLPQPLPAFGFDALTHAPSTPDSSSGLSAVTMPPLARSVAGGGMEDMWQHAKQRACRYWLVHSDTSDNCTVTAVSGGVSSLEVLPLKTFRTWTCRNAQKGRPVHERKPKAARCAGPRAAQPLRTPEGGCLIGDLGDSEWAVFMEALEMGLQQALQEGRWKQAASSGNVGPLGVSCPRF
jgi:hypothetical protein